MLKTASLPLIGVDHELEEVCVVLYDAQWNHLCNISVPVPELVQFQVDFEHVLSDRIRTWFQTAAHNVPEHHTKARQ